MTRRLELRLASAATLLLPAAVCAGLDGLAAQLDPGPRNDANSHRTTACAVYDSAPACHPEEPCRLRRQTTVAAPGLGETLLPAYEA